MSPCFWCHFEPTHYREKLTKHISFCGVTLSHIFELFVSSGFALWLFCQWINRTRATHQVTTKPCAKKHWVVHAVLSCNTAVGPQRHESFRDYSQKQQVNWNKSKAFIWTAEIKKTSYRSNDTTLWDIAAHVYQEKKQQQQRLLKCQTSFLFTEGNAFLVVTVLSMHSKDKIGTLCISLFCSTT